MEDCPESHKYSALKCEYGRHFCQVESADFMPRFPQRPVDVVFLKWFDVFELFYCSLKSLLPVKKNQFSYNIDIVGT